MFNVLLSEQDYISFADFFLCASTDMPMRTKPQYIKKAMHIHQAHWLAEQKEIYKATPHKYLFQSFKTKE
jgi:hypothetical protein